MSELWYKLEEAERALRYDVLDKIADKDSEEAQAVRDAIDKIMYAKFLLK